MHLSPAEYVIHVFGGVRATARAVGRYPNAVCRWKKKSGHIPSAAQRVILSVAKKNNLSITPNDLVYGKEVKM